MEMYNNNKSSGRGEKRGGGKEWGPDSDQEPGNDGPSAAKKPRKVPALASVIVEALKLDSLQRLCSSLEPLLRRIVSEEVERALTKLGHAKLTGRSSPQKIEGSCGRKLQLQFRSRLPPHLFTGGKVEGEQGAAIHVVLLDANTDMVIPSGPESVAKLNVVVLEGDFNVEDDDDWTAEQFESYEVKEREGKRPLMTGDLQVTLKGGVGTLGDLTFTDNSSWIRSRKFRLGAKVAAGFCEGLRVREAKTEAFSVKDHRGELYKKHYPPALHDEVWRLDRIAKDGALHKKLITAAIETVEDFLRLLVRDPQRLRNILGSGMSNRMWDNTVEHAKTCVLGEKLYVHYSDEIQSTGAVFNDIYELRGLITNGQFISVESLSDSEKVSVDLLVKRAYENWSHVVEYDSQVLLSSVNSSKKRQPPLPVKDNPSVDHYFMSPMQSQDFSVASELTVNNFQPERPQTNPSVRLSLDTTQGSNSESCLTGDWSRSQDGQGFDDFFTEEEIRMRGSEILEHDDMQHLLRSFNIGVGGFGNSISYADGSFEPQGEGGFRQQNHGRSNPKAVVGWLKLKAAFRWGIFVRKRAAERRAQLVELD